MRRGKGGKCEGAAERIGMKPRRIRTLIVDDSAFVLESPEGFFREQDGFEVVRVAIRRASPEAKLEGRR